MSESQVAIWGCDKASFLSQQVRGMKDLQSSLSSAFLAFQILGRIHKTYIDQKVAEENLGIITIPMKF